jgi:type IV pilus assembly protein PilN
MLVEINLLPQKQRKRSTTIRIVLLLGVLLLVCTLLFMWQVKRFEKEISGLEANIASSQESINALQENVNAASTNSYVELSNAVEWSENHPIKSVDVLRHLTSLLPERGFILNYAYTETGTITLTVQFDTKKEAAFYLKWLNDSEWIKEVKLSNLSSSQIGESQVGTADTQIDEESYLPRYTGNFDLTLNSEKIREMQKQENETESEEEGGNGE